MWRSSTDRPHGPLVACCALAALCALPATARANPWGHALGHGFAKIGVSHFSAEESYQLGLPTGLEYEATTIDLYAEVGLPWGFTAIAAVPYVIARNVSEGGIDFLNHTFGDSRYELDYRLTDRWPLSVGVETKVPLYSLARDSGVAGIVDVDGALWSASNFPEVGDGTVDLTFKAMAGIGLPWRSGWTAGMVGYQKRFGPFVDAFVASAAVGAEIWRPYLGASLFVSGVVSLRDDPDPAVAASREYLYLQGELSVGGIQPLPDLRLGVSFGGLPVAVNSSRGTSWALNLSYKR